MDTRLARRARGPRVKPLASCLALALALSAGPLAATPRENLANRSVLDTFLDRVRPALDPGKGLPPRKPFDAARYEHMRPLPETIPDLPDAIPVTNCNDSGPGSLRDAIDNIAVSGDTIDLTNTGCSVITLTTGHIFITQTDLTLQGPGSGFLEIYGSHLYSLRHSGGGTLGVYDLAVVGGSKYVDPSTNITAAGGCIYSSGTLAMNGDYLKYCNAYSANPAYIALGGAVYAKTGILLNNSTVFLGSAGSSTGYGFGGGIFTYGSAIVAYSNIAVNSAQRDGGALFSFGLLLKYSSLTDNQAYSGGGAYASGDITVENSTVAGNDALVVGGLFLSGSLGTTSPLTVINSTISGNTAQVVGGIAVTSYPAQIYNSTIAFNVEANSTNAKYGAGLYAGYTTDLESTIIADNTLTHSTYGPISDDIGGPGALSGNNNLTQFVVAPQAAPAGTIYADPLLSSLANNGGLTDTHALSPESPAIDAGNNTAGAAADQRGSGFPRVIGANADIGAFEFDLNDLIFANGFD